MKHFFKKIEKNLTDKKYFMIDLYRRMGREKSEQAKKILSNKHFRVPNGSNKIVYFY